MSVDDETHLTENGEVPVLALPVAELVVAALTGDEHARYDYARALVVSAYRNHDRERETFDAARDLCASDVPTRRALGVDILAGLGDDFWSADGHGGRRLETPAEQRPFHQPATGIVLDLVEREQAAEVLVVIGHALRLAGSRAVAPLGRLRTHPDFDVRWAVAGSLEKLARTDDTALEYLVDLTTDPDGRVRDFACFYLYQTGRDTPRVRDALAARLDDEDVIARGEALRALAQLGDPRTIDPLLDALAAPWPGADQPVLDEALRLLAARTDDPRLSGLS
jgi:hypothetical protein